LQQNPGQVRTFAVKLDDEGWVGVSALGDRCRGHAHPTPELAKLCALHRARGAWAGQNVVLLPLSEPAQPARRSRRRAAGGGSRR
jgi:hypothetical protein